MCGFLVKAKFTNLSIYCKVSAYQGLVNLRDADFQYDNGVDPCSNFG